MPRSTSSVTRFGCVSAYASAERRSPRSAKHQPLVDREVLAQQFHVRDEVPRGVFFEAGVRPAAPATALVEHDDAVPARVEKAARARVRAGAGTAMHENRWFAARIARFLPVDLVRRRDPQPAAAIGFDFRVQLAPGSGGRGIELAWRGHAGIVSAARRAGSSIQFRRRSRRRNSAAGSGCDFAA